MFAGRLPRKKFAAAGGHDEKDAARHSGKSSGVDHSSGSGGSSQHTTPKRNVTLTKSKEKASQSHDEQQSTGSGERPASPDEIIPAASERSGEMPDLISNLADLTTYHDDSDSSIESSGRKSPKKFDAESPDPTFVSVVTIPGRCRC